MINYLTQNPPGVETQQELVKYLCDYHNSINLKLSKDEIECEKVPGRWGREECDCDKEDGEND